MLKILDYSQTDKMWNVLFDLLIKYSKSSTEIYSKSNYFINYTIFTLFS